MAQTASLEKELTKDGTLFVLEKPFDGRAKWLFFWYAFSYFLSVISVVVLCFLTGDSSLLWSPGTVLCVCFVIVFCVLFAIVLTH